MEEFTFEDLEADILDYFSEEAELTRPPTEGELLAEDIMELVNSKSNSSMTRNTTTRQMNRAVEDGKATVRLWRNDEGREVSVYKWVK